MYLERWRFACQYPAMRLVIATCESPLYPSLVDLRFLVLRQPLGYTRQQFDLSGDTKCTYVVALPADSDEPMLGVVALEKKWVDGEPTGEAQLRQMAVRPNLQRSGIGRALVRELEHYAQAQGVRRIFLHARDHAIGFYERLGYVAEGAVFSEVGIPHRLMRKALGGGSPGQI